MKLYTIGFTKKSAQTFFDILKNNKIECLVDIRLHPYGQLAGFSKKDDLKFFLKTINNCEYCHLESLAPTKEILNTFRDDKNWEKYEATFMALLEDRGIPGTLDRSLFEDKICCMLCSEPTPEKCHRRLVAESLAKVWNNVEIIHL